LNFEISNHKVIFEPKFVQKCFTSLLSAHRLGNSVDFDNLILHFFISFKMSTEGQLTPGELDVIRINKERQAAMDRGEITNDKRHLLRGMGALAHIEKVR